MKVYASGEDYLEAILILQNRKVSVRSVDLAEHMGYMKASISHAVSSFRKGGLLIMDSDGFLHLTTAGNKIAEKTFRKHKFFFRTTHRGGC